MPILTLKFKDKVIQEFQLNEGDALTIGRKEDNDVVIENLAVSGSHTKIDSVGDGFLVTDLRSKNGTFVNENLVNSHYLKGGDVITIGKHTLEFSYSEGEAEPDDEIMTDMDQTMIMDTDQQREMLAKTLSKAPASANGQKKGSDIGMLTFLSGGEGEVVLTKKLTKIGKEASSDIVASGLMVGKTAATISIRPQGYFLSYVEGMAKPKVNDKAVKDSIQLEEFDTIEIGSVKVQFLYKS
jgi:pSer/pThr/pTyr-binding forkhead associated (FHA) protein